MASQKHFPARNHGVTRRRMRAMQLALEGLERRYALSAAPTTTPAGLTIGETLASVVNNAALGGIQVQNVTGFAPGPGANYLLLTQPTSSAANPPPFALVSYAGVTNTATTQAFTSLALAAGNGNAAFAESTVVTQAASSTTTNPQTTTFGQLSNPTTNSLTVLSGTAGTGFIGTGFIYVTGASSVGTGGGGNAIFSYNTKTSSPSTGSFKGLKPVGSVGLNEAIIATVTAASATTADVTYTVGNTFSVGQTVSITGLSNAAFNLSGVTITGRTDTTFTVANPTNTTKIPTGSVFVTAASAIPTEVTYTVANNFTVGQTVSITGLSSPAFNLKKVKIKSSTGTAFTVANTTKIPTGSANGTVAGTTTFVQGFNFIEVPAGSIVIEACAPTPGVTIVQQPFLLPKSPSTPFNLAVINGINGFPTATKARPGSAIVALADGTSTIVTYTSNTQNALLGCTVTLLHGQSRQILRNAPLMATANAPVTFSFTNNSFPNSLATAPGLAVYAAIAGQQSDVAGNLTYGYLVPQQTVGKNDFTKSLQFVSMASSPPANVPTFQLFAAGPPGSPMSFKVDNTPNARMVSTRIVFGMGLPPVVPINSSKQPAFPAMSNPSDPNNRTNFDFLEFTMRNTGPNDGTLFVNTTQVDQVGLPFTMNVTPGDSSGASNGVGVMMGRADLANNYATFVKNQFLNSEQKSISPAAEAAFQGLLTPYRLLNPSDAFTNPPANVSVPTLDGYFDAAVATFFANYKSGGFRLERDHYFIGTTKTGYQPAAYAYDGTLGSVSNTTATLTFKASGGKPAAISLGEGVLVTGAGITGTAVVTGQPSVDSNNGTTVTMAGEFTTHSDLSTYTFTAPGEFTVLELEQADASWTPIPKEKDPQNYRLYAPYFFKDSATAFPTGLPVGKGIGSLALSPTNSGSGYTANSVGALTFTGGGGSGATGFYVTDNSGTITAVGLTSPGSGYTLMPTIGFSGPAPTTAAVVTASAMPAAPPWVAPGGPATVQSAGSMTFGCLGVFADGGQQAMAGQITGTNASGQTLSDIQNTIVSAFNRGVANSVASGNDVTASWNIVGNFYPKPVAPVAPLTSGDNWSNLYADFLHQPTVSVARPSVPNTGPKPNTGLAYGFAYDDQGGNSTTLTSSFPQSVNVTFQPWQSTRYAPTPLVFQPGKQPSVSQNKLTATLQGLVNKTYHWQLYQVATPASAAWTAVGQPTSVSSGNRGRVLINAAAPSAGTYVLVAWAADTFKNDSSTATAAAIQFGGQYAVSPRFTVPASQLRVAATPGRVAGLSAARQPVRWAAVGR